MDVKRYIEIRKSQDKHQNNDKKPDIVETLANTISQLQIYLDKLNNGEVHDVEKYKGSRNGDFAKSMILQEKTVVAAAIEPLKNAKSAITRGRVEEEHFHYDLTGTAELGDED